MSTPVVVKFNCQAEKKTTNTVVCAVSMVEQQKAKKKTIGNRCKTQKKRETITKGLEHQEKFKFQEQVSTTIVALIP